VSEPDGRSAPTLHILDKWKLFVEAINTAGEPQFTLAFNLKGKVAICNLTIQHSRCKRPAANHTRPSDKGSSPELLDLETGLVERSFMLALARVYAMPIHLKERRTCDPSLPSCIYG